jgi:hypothetical protein
VQWFSQAVGASKASEMKKIIRKIGLDKPGIPTANKKPLKGQEKPSYDGRWSDCLDPAS